VLAELGNVEHFIALPADEKKRLLKKEKWFKNLPPERKRALREKWQKMSPDERRKFRYKLKKNR